ncbi:unnamed protein product [Brachionus calyciflorus]|uniref:Transposase IS4-like domain-containing protein n=1 Tax=Brachionus calyciflorus TaxID=104777 RepID=A0A814FSA8_9BILA|nr:unnamed protein product [Brachionus calyciflorus]
MLQKLRAKSQNQTLFGQFRDYRLIDEKTIKNTTGLSQEHILDLLSSLRSMRDSINRTKSQALDVYLFWLKTVRVALTEDFVPYNLGPSVMGRDDWVKQNSEIAKELYCLGEDQLVIIADGTYCYCQKSGNYMFQRMTYIGQKKRNLVKPFLFCVTNGRILDLKVPFAAINNDATIIKDLLKKNNDKMKQTLRKNDIFVLDRGFRDAVKELEGLGY